LEGLIAARLVFERNPDWAGIHGGRSVGHLPTAERAARRAGWRGWVGAADADDLLTSGPRSCLEGTTGGVPVNAQLGTD